MIEADSRQASDRVGRADAGEGLDIPAASPRQRLIRHGSGKGCDGQRIVDLTNRLNGHR
jgi:hypothetical protein